MTQMLFRNGRNLSGNSFVSFNPKSLGYLLGISQEIVEACLTQQGLHRCARCDRSLFPGEDEEVNPPNVSLIEPRPESSLSHQRMKIVCTSCVEGTAANWKQISPGSRKLVQKLNLTDASR